jgi:hypothetical protein
VCARRAANCLVQQATAAVPLLIAHTSPTVYPVHAYCSLPFLCQPLLLDWRVFETVRNHYDQWLFEGLKHLRVGTEENAARR